MARFRYVVLALCWLYGCKNPSKDRSADIPLLPAAVPVINYSVGHAYPHDTTSYTEGFVFYDHHFFESSGATAKMPQQIRSMILDRAYEIVFSH
jgi:glutamine cyclotransferase